MVDGTYRMLGDWDLRPILFSPIKFDGGTYEISQEGIADLETVQELGSARGAKCSFVVQFINDPIQAARFRGFCAANSSYADDLRLHEKDAGWFYKVWGISLEKVDPEKGGLAWTISRYNVTCILYSPHSYAAVPVRWSGASLSLPQSKAVTNEGHYDDAFESLEVVCHYDGGHVTDLVLENTAGDTMTVTDEALSDMVILIENGKWIYETYEDMFESATKHNNDTIGDGTFDADHIELDDGEECIYHLAGPHYAHLPVILTLEADIDSGGAIGEATIEVSGDGETYYEAFDQSYFDGLGQVDLSLQDTTYMQDIWVKFKCNSGTSGKKLNISYLKFYVRRRLEPGDMPVALAGKSTTFEISCNESYSDLVDISAEFRSRRLLE